MQSEANAEQEREDTYELGDKEGLDQEPEREVERTRLGRFERERHRLRHELHVDDEDAKQGKATQDVEDWESFVGALGFGARGCSHAGYWGLMKRRKLMFVRAVVSFLGRRVLTLLFTVGSELARIPTGGSL